MQRATTRSHNKSSLELGLYIVHTVVIEPSMALTSLWSPSLWSTVLFTTLETVSPSSICTVSWWEPSMVTSCDSMPSADTYLWITFRVIWRTRQREQLCCKTVSVFGWFEVVHDLECPLTFLTTMLPCSSVYFSSVTVCDGISGRLSACKRQNTHSCSCYCTEGTVNMLTC